MQNANDGITPMELNMALPETSYPCDKPRLEVIGSLHYLSVGTCPDIAFAVARKMQHQGE